MGPTSQCVWKGTIEDAVGIWRMEMESLLVSLPFRRLFFKSWIPTLNLARKIAILFELL